MVWLFTLAGGAGRGALANSGKALFRISPSFCASCCSSVQKSSAGPVAPALRTIRPVSTSTTRASMRRVLLRSKKLPSTRKRAPSSLPTRLADAASTFPDCPSFCSSSSASRRARSTTRTCGAVEKSEISICASPSRSGSSPASLPV